jgi:hypothetical protein
MTTFPAERALPIRVPVTPGESLDSWLAALARRNGMPVNALLPALGWPPPRRPYSLVHGVPAPTLRRVERQTGLPPGRLDQAVFDRYDQLGPARRGNGRHCPHCLSETDGRRPLRWRLLPWVFACTDHHVLLRGGHPGADTPDPPRLAPDDPLLATQHHLNTLLSAAEAGPASTLAPAPAAALTDLGIVAGWLLRRPADHHSRDVQPGTRRAPGRLPPADAALAGAAASTALSLVTGDDDHAVAQLRPLLRGTTARRYGVRPPGLPTPQWRQLSDPVQGRLLRALDPDLAHIDRIRYRSARAGAIPQLLWPEWTIRLLPAAGFRVDRFRAVISACLLLPGNPTRKLRHVTAHLHPHLRGQISQTLNALADAGHQSVFTAICHLADYLDKHPSPIDYHHRRATITAATISQHDWQQLSNQAGAHPGQQVRLRNARRYLYQLLTGADLADPSHTLAIRSRGDQHAYTVFTTTLTTPLRAALADYATGLLHQFGIDEPLTWQPPADCTGHLDPPGRDPDDIDLSAVHQAVITERLPLPEAADRLHTTTAHIRLALERIPRPPRSWSANAAPATRERRQRARHLLTRDLFEREYLTNRKRLHQIAAETGFDDRLVAQHAKQAGITFATARDTFHIDEDWLREQYLTRQRSYADIARELGVANGTVILRARRYGIPSRLAGINSHPHMLHTLGEHVPPDIRRAVEGGLHGWHRLRRFQTTMTFPTIQAAADHIQIGQSSLVTQLHRLERDIGAPLYHRSDHHQPMQPTPRGTAVLQALAQPAIQALAAANDRSVRSAHPTDR